MSSQKSNSEESSGDYEEVTQSSSASQQESTEESSSAAESKKKKVTNEFLRESVKTDEASADDEDETPSLEKHGFWIFPPTAKESAARQRELKRQGRKSNRRAQSTPKQPQLEKKQPRRSKSNVAQSNRRRQMSRCPMHMPRCCCCRCRCCCCPNLNAQFGQTAYPVARRRRSRPKESKSKPNVIEKSKYRHVNLIEDDDQEEALEGYFEDHGFQDMMLASVCVNKAKSCFCDAIEDAKHPRTKSKKDTKPSPSSSTVRRSEVRVLPDRSDDSMFVNKAQESFDKAVQNERDIREIEKNAKPSRKSGRSN